MERKTKLDIIETIKSLPPKDKAFIYGWAAGRMSHTPAKRKPKIKTA